jgi:hypothetical protein
MDTPLQKRTVPGVNAEASNSSVTLQSGFTRPRDAATRIGLYNSNFEPLRGNDVAPYPDVTGHYDMVRLR